MRRKKSGKVAWLADRVLVNLWYSLCYRYSMDVLLGCCYDTHKKGAVFMTSHEKQKSTRIDRRDDVNPAEGEHKYGEVEFADPVNNKYPVDTSEHVRAAWSYINHKDNAAKYDADDVRQIKSRIKRAAKKHGVEIEEDS
jgi:hypothetical protein